MKNKLLKLLILSLILVLGLVMIHKELKNYDRNVNIVLAGIIEEVKENYPEIEEEKIIKLLNSKNLSDKVIKDYGIDLNLESLSVANKQVLYRIIVIIVLIAIIYSAFGLGVSYYDKKVNERKLRHLRLYLKDINDCKYDLAILENKQDEYSKLKNELYQTAVLLNEQTRNLNIDKENLKKSLENISHQLKTPLTSINLILENLAKDNLTKSEYERKIMEIKHKIGDINFLVQELLKLARLDANVIKFDRKKYQVKEIIDTCIKNVEILAELKDVRIVVHGELEKDLVCDYKWLVEALSNILKNSIEHSNASGIININLVVNEVFTRIEIKDNGSGIPKKDLPFIFERFYSSDNSDTNTGIGLSLAKEIILKSGGLINVTSKVGEGTTFIIKFVN